LRGLDVITKMIRAAVLITLVRICTLIQTQRDSLVFKTTVAPGVFQTNTDMPLIDQLELTVNSPSHTDDIDHDHDHDDHADLYEISISWSCSSIPLIDRYELSFELIRVIPPEDKISMHFHSQQRNQLLSTLHDADTNVEKTRVFLIKILEPQACEYSTRDLEPNALYRAELSAFSKCGDLLKMSKSVTFRTGKCLQQLTYAQNKCSRQ
jgi:hypothetical protein